MVHDVFQSQSFLRLSLYHTQNEAFGKDGKIVREADIDLKDVLFNDLLDLILRP